MKLPTPLVELVDHARPATSTEAPALHPDLGPGAGQARDAALDEQAREGMTAALPDYVPPPATADVDDAIEAGREAAACPRCHALQRPCDCAAIDDLSAEDIASRLRSNIVGDERGMPEGTSTEFPLPRNPERTVALRKLLEAKDAAVRAALAKDTP